MSMYDDVLPKLLRGLEHLDALESEVVTFMNTTTPPPFEAIAADDHASGDWVVRVKINSMFPIRWSLVIGDVLQNLRTALDHLVWQLVLVNGGTPTPLNAFPITRHAADWPKESAKRLNGLSADAQKRVAALAPYNGGNQNLWQLHHLSRIDRHRLLLAVGAVQPNVVIDFGTQFGHSFPVALKAADREFPLQNGAEIYRVMAAARGQGSAAESPNFSFEAAFGDGDSLNGEPIVSTLRRLATEVSNDIERFKDLLT